MDSTWKRFGEETRGNVDRLDDMVLFVVFLASAVDEKQVHVLESTLFREVPHSRASPG